MPQSKHNKLIIILGPTASGKSSLAVCLAKQFNGEIISADSRQVYREMDIGTAKISEKGMADIPHYLIDIIRPDQPFTLAQFKKRAVKKINESQEKGKLPFLVGGTGLYIQTIADNLKIPRVKPDKKLRERLEGKTSQQLYRQLKKIDPKALAEININNKRRIIRALEVCLLTGKPFSRQKEKGQPLFDICQIGINLNREKLDKRISQRIEEMLAQGLIEEVQRLAKKYSSTLPSLSGIGYQEIISYLNNEITLEQAKELIKVHTRQYARRQISWFKRDSRVHWIKNKKQAEIFVKNHLKTGKPRRISGAKDER